MLDKKVLKYPELSDEIKQQHFWKKLGNVSITLQS
jgi:hypothetical protein